MRRRRRSLVVAALSLAVIAAVVTVGCPPAQKGEDPAAVSEGTLAFTTVSPERITGMFSHGDQGLSFDVGMAADSGFLRVETTQGRLLVSTDLQPGLAETSLLDGRLRASLDTDRLRSLGGASPERTPARMREAISTEGELATVDELVEDSGYQLLPVLSRALGAAGLSGQDYPTTLPLHLAAVGASSLLDTAQTSGQAGSRRSPDMEDFLVRGSGDEIGISYLYILSPGVDSSVWKIRIDDLPIDPFCLAPLGC